MILIVEDNELNRDVLERSLARAGYEVAAATDGLQAIDMARDLRPDLILMDIGLPQLDGCAAARRIRTDDPDTPIIALSAHALPDDRARALDAGCSDYVTKPIDIPALLTLIGERLGD